MANKISWGPGIIQSHWNGLNKLALVWKGCSGKKINLKWLGDLWKYPAGSCDVNLQTIETGIEVIYLTCPILILILDGNVFLV